MIWEIVLANVILVNSNDSILFFDLTLFCNV